MNRRELLDQFVFPIGVAALVVGAIVAIVWLAIP